MVKLLNREETCQYIQNKISCSEKINIVRYSDGEYLLMTKQGDYANEDASVVSTLLINAIKTSNQLVCINELKSHNLSNNDIWVTVHEYLKSAGQHLIYGAANWNIHDYMNGCKTLPYFFKNKTLLISFYADLFCSLMPKSLNIIPFKTTEFKASYRYKDFLNDIRSFDVDNIIFACGPIGKVLLSDLTISSKANLIDLGSLINAVIDGLDSSQHLVKKWHMSWCENRDLKFFSESFIEKVKEIL